MKEKSANIQCFGPSSRSARSRTGRGAKIVSGRNKFGRDIVASELSVPHIDNQLEFARIFLNVAQKGYGSGNAEAGQEAETRVKIALVEAKRSSSELSPHKQFLLSAKLDVLHLALDNLERSTDHNSRGTRRD
jgi:hypothetical protein